MKELVKNKKLKLQYVPDNGAWTFHIVIPHTKILKELGDKSIRIGRRL